MSGTVEAVRHPRHLTRATSLISGQHPEQPFTTVSYIQTSSSLLKSPAPAPRTPVSASPSAVTVLACSPSPNIKQSTAQTDEDIERLDRLFAPAQPHEHISVFSSSTPRLSH